MTYLGLQATSARQLYRDSVVVGVCSDRMLTWAIGVTLRDSALVELFVHSVINGASPSPLVTKVCTTLSFLICFYFSILILAYVPGTQRLVLCLTSADLERFQPCSTHFPARRHLTRRMLHARGNRVFIYLIRLYPELLS